MKAEKFEQLVTRLTEERLAISRERRKGYASDEDCLENFKVLAQICKLMKVDVTKPEGLAAFWVLHKLQRRLNMMAKGIDLKERRVDTDLDAHNYIDLMIACEEDAKGGMATQHLGSLDLEDS